ncbi:MAG: ASKHA domain-containing protein [Treponema sp.]|jgi:uncharacterized 2Fe-2S/4Fe-4S cluster protein (DUF4445 family)|nr:ASKHA domain-containing protein [Treponema sp.]
MYAFGVKFEIMVVYRDPNTGETLHKIIGYEGSVSLLEALQAQGFRIPAVCGGRGRCGKCKVRLLESWIEPAPPDIEYFSPAELNEGWRLSCILVPTKNLRIFLPFSDETSFAAVDDFEPIPVEPGNLDCDVFRLEKKPESFIRQLEKTVGRGHTLEELSQAAKLAPLTAEGKAQEQVYVQRYRKKIVYISREPQNLYGIAVDIGTTTITLCLVNLGTGKISARRGMVNKQREYGADVISRIKRANDGDLEAMSQSVRDQIAEGAAFLLNQTQIKPDTVKAMAVAANTGMLHLLFGLSCAALGRFPFTPVTLDFIRCGYGELFQGDIRCEVTALPGISAYVGADITAGLLFTRIQDSENPVLFMDIGTNGEMALKVENRLLVAAAAAGPAFEGGNIRWGMGSVSGAIARASFRDGLWRVTTIGGKPALGICGSGLVDAVSEGLRWNLIESSGRFSKAAIENNGIILGKTQDGEYITLEQKDIRELQLAKSAICSGVYALLHHEGLKSEDIEVLYIAGGFGYHLDFRAGTNIGLIPPNLLPKTRLIGNSSLGGAVRYLLDRKAEETLIRIVAASEEYQLSGDPYFNELFIEQVTFEKD